MPHSLFRSHATSDFYRFLSKAGELYPKWLQPVCSPGIPLLSFNPNGPRPCSVLPAMCGADFCPCHSLLPKTSSKFLLLPPFFPIFSCLKPNLSCHGHRQSHTWSLSTAYSTLFPLDQHLTTFCLVQYLLVRSFLLPSQKLGSLVISTVVTIPTVPYSIVRRDALFT